jgi:hypothetical protein
MRESQDEDRAGFPLRAYLELVRLPNVFTAAADVMMGYLVVEGTFQEYVSLAMLVATSCCLYLAGMVFNDVFDREIDAIERPERPIPSGRVSANAARRLGTLLLSIAMIVSLQLSWKYSTFAPLGIACGIAGLVLLYDKWLKHTPIGPIAMGGCRFLNVFLGMSLMHDAPALMHWMLAGGVGLYVMGITVFARGEAEVSSRHRLIFATLIMLTGILLVTTSSRFAPEHQAYRLTGTPQTWSLFWILFTGLILYRNSRAIVFPSPKYVQRAVKTAILSLIVIDAAASLPMSLGMFSPTLILLMIVPATFLGRWIYST